MMQILAIAALAIVHGASAPTAKPTTLHYTVDMSNRAAHVFAVSLQVPGLGANNDVFEFAATAPGTYQVMDMGRYVRSFHALDQNGRELPVDHITINQWKISNPAAVRTISYTIVATRDTLIKEHVVYPMCGTALRDDYAQINGQAVFGFPKGMQASKIGVKLVHPSDWIVGTALNRLNGEYQAESYDQLVDSPFLLGSTVTTTTVNVTGVRV
jgi:predicted metalloprotease with PDZ domain